MVIEVVVAPPSGIGIALGIFHGYVGAVKRSGEVAPTRRLGSRTIRVLAWQGELKLLEEDRAFGKCIRLLVYLV